MGDVVVDPTNALELCQEDGHERCGTHQAEWPLHRVVCNAVNETAYWAARRERAEKVRREVLGHD